MEHLGSVEQSQFIDVDWMIGKGCNRCGYTGYSGRMVVVELLSVSTKLRDLIAKNRPVSELERCAQEEGMIGLRQATLAKAVKGDTSLREVNRVVYRE
jgi:type II secretory ATPase GspE/PulE/Tfp pilus assembly ATPase PilB-like protein